MNNEIHTEGAAADVRKNSTCTLSHAFSGWHILEAKNDTSQDVLLRLCGSGSVGRDTASGYVFASGHGRKESIAALDSRKARFRSPNGNSPCGAAAGRFPIGKNSPSLSDGKLGHYRDYFKLRHYHV